MDMKSSTVCFFFFSHKRFNIFVECSIATVWHFHIGYHPSFFFFFSFFMEYVDAVLLKSIKTFLSPPLFISCNFTDKGK